MSLKICGVIAFAAMLSFVNAYAQGMDNGKAAVDAAEKWIVLVDAGNNVDSWKEASSYFKDTIKPDQWEQSLKVARRPLGKLISRNLWSKTYTTNALPGAPDCEYVVIQFEASFQNKISTVETITPMMEKDGRWRVSGYYIK